MKIVLCIPGESFSRDFLICLVKFISQCVKNKIQVTLHCKYSCNIYIARNLCLGGDTLRGKNQKPFNGTYDYDYILWVDSDIIFTYNDFILLVNMKKNIASGLYLMHDNIHFATVEYMNDNYFLENGHYQFLQTNDLKLKKQYFTADYTGFGFILIKNGVFESLEYPWFDATTLSFENGSIVDFTMEDVSFCLKIKDKFKIWINKNVIVGHKKPITLIPAKSLYY